MVSKALLKNEIDQLDEAYLELAYNLLRQIPHRVSSAAGTQFSASHERDPMRHSLPIQYQVTEDLHDVTPFADIDDAAAYVCGLRRQQWTRYD